MGDETFYIDLMSRKLNKNKYLYSKVLTEDIKQLLEEYAPKLFKDIDTEREVGKMMKGLIQVVYKYLYEKSEYSISNDAKKRITTYKKHSKKDKIIALKKKIKKSEEEITSIKKVIDLMGGETLHTVQGQQLKKNFNELQKHLQNAYKYPEEYIPEITTSKISKKEIEDYLKKLKLYKKDHVIKDFIAYIG